MENMIINLAEPENSVAEFIGTTYALHDFSIKMRQHYKTPENLERAVQNRELNLIKVGNRYASYFG